MTRPAPLSRPYAAFLFDMDGTLINSLAACNRIWGRWATEKGLDLDSFLPTIHGRRGIDTIASLGRDDLDPVAEAAFIEAAEIADVEGVIAIEAAIDFLAALPPERWAIVTSAPVALARARLAAAGIPHPGVMITAEDVSQGKPHPGPFLLAAERLGFSAADCLVFEDAPAGIAAAVAAGSDVVVVAATHDHFGDTPHPVIVSYRDIVHRPHVEGLAVSLQAG